MNLEKLARTPEGIEKLLRLALFGKKYNLQIEDITPEAIGALPVDALPEAPATGNYHLVSTDGVLSWEEIV